MPITSSSDESDNSNDDVAWNPTPANSPMNSPTHAKVLDVPTTPCFKP